MQVKGKRKAVSVNVTNMNYILEVNALKKYLQDGGIIYFVVAFSEDQSKNIFYKILLPYDLRRTIDDAGHKKSMNISFQKLPSDCDTIRQVFIAFLEDKKRQAPQIVWSEKQAAEAVAAGNTFSFHIFPLDQSSTHFDMMKAATLQDFYVYVKTKDGIEIPFEKKERAYSTVAIARINIPVCVNGVKFYDFISHGYENGNAFFRIGNVIKVPVIGEGEKTFKT